MKIRAIGLVSILTSLLFGFGCSSNECSGNGDCNTGEVCVEGTCTETGGGGGRCDCAPGQTCDSDGKCVDCVTDAQCPNHASCSGGQCVCDKGRHPCGGECVPDDDVMTCGDRCSPCDVPVNGSATCDGMACDIVCDQGFVECATCTNRCAECDPANNTCPASAPACVAGTCSGCRSDNDCPTDARPFCASSGVCVECTAEDESRCGENVCDIAQGTCSDELGRSARLCESCLSDSHCAAGARCVKMSFNGDVRTGGYCLQESSAECTAPYPYAVTRTSLAGSDHNVCSINEMIAVCEAVLNYSNPCAFAEDCAPGGIGAVCEPIEFDVAGCTYPCEVAADECAGDFGCLTGYCGGY